MRIAKPLTIIVAILFMLPARSLAGDTTGVGNAVSAAERSGYQDYHIRTVVIDPGHGGKDPGTQWGGVREKNVVLSIALKLGRLIQEQVPGVKVIYTRTDDRFIELYERGRIANRNNADLFISIHCNANNSTRPYGAETYTLGLHRTETNFEVAKRENQAILLEEDYKERYEGFDPNSPESYIIFSLQQSQYMAKSISLADKIQQEFGKVGRHNRGVKQAGFIVLHQTAMPAVLVETGFVSNANERWFLNSEAGQNKIANSILNAFKAYKQNIESTQ